MHKIFSSFCSTIVLSYEVYLSKLYNNKWVQRNHDQILLCKIPIGIIQQVQLNIVLNQMLYHIIDKNIPCAQSFVYQIFEFIAL